MQDFPPQSIDSLSRRRFLAQAVATGAALSASGAAFAQGSPGPVAGGHLRLGLAGGSTSDSLDPSPWGDTFMSMVGYAVRGGLVEYGQDGSLRPDAAASWEYSNGGSRWAFTLQRDAVFSNGKPLTAADVVASLNLHRGPNSRSTAKAILDPVTDIKADGDHTVIITLSSPIVDFPYSLTDQHFNIMPAVDGEADWRSGIGAGPYVIEHFEPGVRAILKRNPNSYKSAWLESAELIGITDVVARQAALMTKEVDVINRVDLKTARLLGQRAGLRVEENAGRLEYTLAFDTRLDPISRADVRTALKYAIDREEILRVVFNGHGAIGNDQPITPAYRYHNDQLPAKTYDPDKAKFHLKKAGLDGVRIDFHTSEAAFTGAVDLSVLHARQAAKAGIDINVIRVAPDNYLAATATPAIHSYATYWSGRATEDAILTLSQGAQSPRNNSHWNNPDFERMLVAARGETDEAKRKSMYFELQRLTSEDGGVIVPIFANSVYAMSDKVGRPQKIADNWELDGARLIERWWMRG